METIDRIRRFTREPLESDKNKRIWEKYQKTLISYIEQEENLLNSGRNSIVGKDKAHQERIVKALTKPITIIRKMVKLQKLIKIKKNLDAMLKNLASVEKSIDQLTQLLGPTAYPKFGQVILPGTGSKQINSIRTVSEQ